VLAERRGCRRNDETIGGKQIRRYLGRRDARPEPKIFDARLLNMPKDGPLFLRSGSRAHQQENYAGQLLRYPHQKISPLGDVDTSRISRNAFRRLETEVGPRGLPG
jgi:hypothetical protein